MLGADPSSAAPATPDASSDASSASAVAPAAIPGNAGALLDQAKDWLNKSGLAESTSQLPQTLKDAGAKAWTGLGRLSTAEKIVGGAVLLGAGYLAFTQGRGGKSLQKKRAANQRWTGPGSSSSYASKRASNTAYDNDNVDSYGYEKL
ncbi:hypothetical protein GCM10023186_12670 [Hymenobacter koreensis]|uniref:DUF4235 domain-containing protein n=2 Tax=Hymenobacter koreensis TaxID=1084523 RepID=A0ABP8IX79_9BACT